MSFFIRDATPADLPFMHDMMWEAAAVDGWMRELGKEAALAHPLNQKYIAEWGRPGDVAVIAVDDSGEPLGAAWFRTFSDELHGYGYISADVPELTISVAESARGRGVGSALITALKERAAAAGHTRMSLSVDRRNPAMGLYERCGFRNAGVTDPDEIGVTMVADLEPVRD